MFSDILLTVDYDRTLTAPDSTIPARNIEAIEYFIRHGGAFTVNTGRSLPMARPFIGKFPVSAPLLLYNGSAAYDTATETFSRVYPIELDITEFTTHLQALFPDLVVEVQAMDTHHGLRRDADWEKFSENGGCGWAYTEPVRIPGPFLKVSLNGSCAGHTAASMYDATPEEFLRMKEAIDTVRRLYGHKVDVFHSVPKIADIHAKGVSKLKAARDLQKAMGRKWLVCVGDAHNDVPMLDGADFAYCPCDGVIADRYENVCCCGDGAVADVIYEKIPKILKNKA